MIKNTLLHFGIISKLLHWSMALLLTGMFAVGLYMTSLDYYDPLYHSLPWWHKSVGLTVMLLLILRFTWRHMNPIPQPLAAQKQWESIVASIIHTLFYLMIFLCGSSGYLIATAKGKSVAFYTFFDIPAITQNLAESQADMMGEIHEILAFTLAALVIIHALAALKHHFVDKDETLKRMI